MQTKNIREGQLMACVVIGMSLCATIVAQILGPNREEPLRIVANHSLNIIRAGVLSSQPCVQAAGCQASLPRLTRGVGWLDRPSDVQGHPAANRPREAPPTGTA